VRWRRSRPLYAILVLLTVAAGLASRSALADHLPDFIGNYAGDTLWALALFLVLGFVFSKVWPGTVAMATLALSFTVEFSQLYQADWINAVRATQPGALILGHGFLWTDLLCYTVGCAIGWFGEIVAGAASIRSR